LCAVCSVPLWSSKNLSPDRDLRAYEPVVVGGGGTRMSRGLRSAATSRRRRGGYEQGQQMTNGAANGQADDKVGQPISERCCCSLALRWTARSVQCRRCWRAARRRKQAEGQEAKSAENQLSSFHGVIERTICCFLSVAVEKADGKEGATLGNLRPADCERGQSLQTRRSPSLGSWADLFGQWLYPLLLSPEILHPPRPSPLCDSPALRCSSMPISHLC
jgi:hypothetical protein